MAVNFLLPHSVALHRVLGLPAGCTGGGIKLSPSQLTPPPPQRAGKQLLDFGSVPLPGQELADLGEGTADVKLILRLILAKSAPNLGSHFPGANPELRGLPLRSLVSYTGRNLKWVELRLHGASTGPRRTRRTAELLPGYPSPKQTVAR